MKTAKNWLLINSALALAVLAGTLMMALPVAAASGGNTGSANQNITQAYNASGPLERGMIVGLEPKASGTVFALDTSHVKQMQGVIVAANDAPVTLSDTNTSGQVYVATLGRYPVLVSNQNGPIKAGDYIAISSLAGIGMKADSSSQLVVGKAAGNFDGNNNVLGDETLHGGTTSQTVAIGLVNVDLGIAHNPLETAKRPVAGIGWLQNAADSVTGNNVALARIYAAIGIFIIVAIIVIIVLYSGIRGGMLATGRNPLAKASISRNLFEVILTAVVIFIIGLGAIYLILKL